MTPQWAVFHGDALELLRTLPDCCVDSVVTDPPAGIKFMGRHWDSNKGGSKQWIAWLTEITRECLRVLKPGGHALFWALPRTSHWTATAVEDGGFELRDVITHHFGSGMPKSHDASKQIDKKIAAECSRIAEAASALDINEILLAWQQYLHRAPTAGLLVPEALENSVPERAAFLEDLGHASLINGATNAVSYSKGEPVNFALGDVALSANQENALLSACFAELNYFDHLHTYGVRSGVHESAAANMVASSSIVNIAASLQASICPQSSSVSDPSVLNDAWGWPRENTTDKITAVEALKTWLGKRSSSKTADIAVLCAALTNDLKRITLSRSKTFQSYDTIQQTVCVSATVATTTISTAALLLSFTVAMLRRAALAVQAQACNRQVYATYTAGGNAGTSTAEKGGTYGVGVANSAPVELQRTLGGSPEARRWDGFGTGLKPSSEHWILARKPLVGTLADNLLAHGAGALNIDGCRVDTDRPASWAASGHSAKPDAEKIAAPPGIGMQLHPSGRWPTNAVFSHSSICAADACAPDCPVRVLEAQSGILKSGALNQASIKADNNIFGKHQGYSEPKQYAPDTGTAARFFPVFEQEHDPFLYTAKASTKEREAGCEGVPPAESGRHNDHTTVKPVALMRWLVRLSTPPGGLCLDIFCGSGTTGAACVLEGFNFMGFEAEERFVEISRARIAYWAARP